MKSNSFFMSLKIFTLVLFSGLFNNLVAQGDSGSTTSSSTSTRTVTTQTQTWYSEPWMWIVGAIVVIVIIALLVRNNSSTSDTTRTTVIKTRD